MRDKWKARLAHNLMVAYTAWRLRTRMATQERNHADYPDVDLSQLWFDFADQIDAEMTRRVEEAMLKVIGNQKPITERTQ